MSALDLRTLYPTPRHRAMAGLGQPGHDHSAPAASTGPNSVDVINALASGLTQVGAVAAGATSQVLVAREQAKAIREGAKASRFATQTASEARAAYLYPALGIGLVTAAVGAVVYVVKRRKRRRGR